MLKISIRMYDPILHSDTGVNSKVPRAYLPLKEEDCARARLSISDELPKGLKAHLESVRFKLHLYQVCSLNG
jgi:hypothetical protein